MASSRDTLNGPDFQDILVVLNELESSLDCRVIVELAQKARQGVKVLEVKVTAYPLFSLDGVQRHSVSLSVTLDRSGSGLGVAAMYRALLALDYEASKKWAVKQT